MANLCYFCKRPIWSLENVSGTVRADNYGQGPIGDYPICNNSYCVFLLKVGMPVTVFVLAILAKLKGLIDGKD